MLTLWLLLTAVARAHPPDGAAQPQPLALINLALLGGLYVVGFARQWARAPRRRPALARWGAAFLAAAAVTGVALLSPLDRSADRLAWAHMVQHLLLMMVAAPLLTLACPVRVVAPWGLPERLRSPVARVRAVASRLGAGRYLVWQPIATWSLFLGTLWLWHLPALYEAALRHAWVHDLQHLGFVGASALFWGVVLDPVARQRLHPPLAVAYLFATSLQAMMLGVLMTLSPRAWYPAYGAGGARLTLLEDQQVAGAIMWMPGCLLYAVVAAWLAARWLAREGASR